MQAYNGDSSPHMLADQEVGPATSKDMSLVTRSSNEAPSENNDTIWEPNHSTLTTMPLYRVRAPSSSAAGL